VGEAGGQREAEPGVCNGALREASVYVQALNLACSQRFSWPLKQ
jgi:hypothetical protein